MADVSRPDEVDQAILDCYRDDPGASAAAVGRRVNLGETAVRERTRRLIASGVLSFAAAIDYDRVSSFSIEAYIEAAFPGDADVHRELERVVRDVGRREIREAITLVGDVDALLRVRARNLTELRQLVARIRACDSVIGTKTRIIAGRWWHGRNLDTGEMAA